MLAHYCAVFARKGTILAGIRLHQTASGNKRHGDRSWYHLLSKCEWNLMLAHYCAVLALKGKMPAGIRLHQTIGQ